MIGYNMDTDLWCSVNDFGIDKSREDHIWPIDSHFLGHHKITKIL